MTSGCALRQRSVIRADVRPCFVSLRSSSMKILLLSAAAALALGACQRAAEPQPTPVEQPTPPVAAAPPVPQEMAPAAPAAAPMAPAPAPPSRAATPRSTRPAAPQPAPTPPPADPMAGHDMSNMDGMTMPPKQ